MVWAVGGPQAHPTRLQQTIHHYKLIATLLQLLSSYLACVYCCVMQQWQLLIHLTCLKVSETLLAALGICLPLTQSDLR